jgi:hypothetical protein
MPIHRRPLLVLVSLLPVALLSGCKEGQKPGAQAPQGAAAPAAPAKPGFTPQTYEGVTFQYPSAWSSAPSQDGKGQTVTAPETDTEWPASITISVVPESGSLDLQKAIDEAVVTLPNRRDRFTLREKTVAPHPGGFQYGRVEYTSESGTTALTQWEILIPTSGGKKVVVHANSATEDWTKYQPVFGEIVQSIRLPKSGGSAGDAARRGVQARRLNAERRRTAQDGC